MLQIVVYIIIIIINSETMITIMNKYACIIEIITGPYLSEGCNKITEIMRGRNTNQKSISTSFKSFDDSVKWRGLTNDEISETIIFVPLYLNETVFIEFFMVKMGIAFFNKKIFIEIWLPQFSFRYGLSKVLTN